MSEAVDLGDLMPRRSSVVFSIGLLSGFLGALALAFFVMIARAASEPGSEGGQPVATATAPTVAALAGGEAIASSQGCVACHTLDGSSGVGPTWLGMAGTERQLEGGAVVTADAAYLEQSIVDPRAQIVAGFPEAAMPANYGETLSTDEIAQLIEFITELGP